MTTEARTDYTIRVIKFDKRTKTGEKFVKDYDYKDMTKSWMEEEIRDLASRLYPAKKFRLELHETWVERINIMTGNKFKERFDTPYYCSPSSESYFSM